MLLMLYDDEDDPEERDDLMSHQPGGRPRVGHPDKMMSLIDY